MSEDLYFCYESLNKSCPKIIYPTVIRVLLHIFYMVVIVITLCGNLLVIISIAHFRQLHTPTNYLILSLAVTDFLMGGFIMPPYMVHIIESCWYFGDVFYRYYAVCQPLHYQTKITTCAAVIMILVCWSVSVCVGFGMIFLELNILGIEDFYYENVACVGGCILFQSQASSSISSILSFYIPGFIMMVIYQKIFHVAQKQAQSIHIACNNVHSENSTPSSNKERKATKTLAIVMGIFLSFYAPFFMCNLINPFINYSIPVVLLEILFCITYLNSTCNPVIYGFYYSWFRKAFKIIIFGKVFQADSSSANLSTE
ncbi:trace amine-associated receptor 1-like [Conger conger]|uniref:trace amine-associated receptor 1-like n=1 Tax=Conger conger TaxID=82655 RepID=UPI002A5AAF38|nr:trace amine-associated receptor 1-like [Conger conger]